jgi:hypothetical protein
MFLIKAGNRTHVTYGGFKLEPIFDTAPAASKNEAHVKSGQN